MGKRVSSGDWLPEGPETWPGAEVADPRPVGGLALRDGTSQEGKGLFLEFYAIIAQIPRGKVATYGQIARLAGHPRAARMVGWALSSSPEGLGLPCHRVVNREGGMAPGWEDQRPQLEAEGVTFLSDGRVDLEAHRW